MIEFQSAIAHDRDEDKSRNRILMTFGVRQLNLTRVEARQMVIDLQKTLDETEPQELKGMVQRDGRVFTLTTEDGEQLSIQSCSVPLYRFGGKPCTLSGLYIEGGVFYVFECSPQ